MRLNNAVMVSYIHQTKIHKTSKKERKSKHNPYMTSMHGFTKLLQSHINSPNFYRVWMLFSQDK